MFSLISVNWTAQALTDAQLLVLRNVAAQFLRKQKKGSTIDFSHPLCEGRLTKKSEGLFVTFAGTFFHADLGHVRGERWTVDFLLPSNSEYIVINDDCIVYSVRPLKGGDAKMATVDHQSAEIPEDHSVQ